MTARKNDGRKRLCAAVFMALAASLPLRPALAVYDATGGYSNVTTTDPTTGQSSIVGSDMTDPNLGGATQGHGLGTSTGDSSLDDSKNNVVCPNTRLVSGKIFSATCWACLFPIVSMGIKVPFGGGEDELPEDRSRKFICVCRDKMNVPYFGMLWGNWQPTRVVEFVRKPGCLAFLDGMKLKISSAAFGEMESETGENASSGAQGNYHIYAYPLLIMLNMMETTSNCIKDSYMDIDILFMSEVDPTWNDDELAFFSSPEAALVNNPVGQLACIGDAVSSTVLKRPVNSLFWCAGSWGVMYPLAGSPVGDDGALDFSSLMLDRVLFALHRRGFLQVTYGDAALCKGNYSPHMPKTQYKFTMLYPVPETHTSHVSGEATLRWGTGRMVPVTGEDYVYLVWAWNDCCMPLSIGM